MGIPRNLSNLAPGANTTGVLGTSKGGTGLATVGTNGQVLQSNGTALVFATPATTSPAGSTGQIQYNNAGVFGALSDGTSGQVLTSAGVGSAPTWTNLSSPYTLISTTNVAGATNVDFNNLSASAYSGGYILVLNNVLPASNTQFIMRYFQSGSLYTTADIRYSFVSLASGTGQFNGNTNVDSVILSGTAENVSNDYAGSGVSGTVNFQILTSKNSPVVSDLYFIGANTACGNRIITQSWPQKTSYFALTGIRLSFTSGTMSSGTIRLYGVNL